MTALAAATGAMYRRPIYENTQVEYAPDLNDFVLREAAGWFAGIALSGTVAALQPHVVVYYGFSKRHPMRDITATSWLASPFHTLLRSPETPSICANAILSAPRAEPLLPEETEDPPAYQAFKRLAGWMMASDEQIAESVGIGRTTVYSWKRDNREPRIGTAQRIYEYHAVLDSVRRRLGLEGLRSWLLAGEPTRRELLLEGNLEAVEGAVHEILFRPRPTGVDLAWAPEDTGAPEPSTSRKPLRPSSRSPRRARIR